MYTDLLQPAININEGNAGTGLQWTEENNPEGFESHQNAEINTE
jgi:hypothetical protein